jgi:hypothetical protein
MTRKAACQKAKLSCKNYELMQTQFKCDIVKSGNLPTFRRNLYPYLYGRIWTQTAGVMSSVQRLDYRLDGLVFDSRYVQEIISFSKNVQTSSEAHPGPYPMGTFPGLKWPGREVDHSPPPSAEVTPSTGLHAVYRKKTLHQRKRSSEMLLNLYQIIRRHIQVGSTIVSIPYPTNVIVLSVINHTKVQNWTCCSLCIPLYTDISLVLVTDFSSVCLSVRNNSVIFTRHTSAHITSKRIQLTSTILHFRLFEVISGLIYMPAEIASPQDKARLT